MRYPAFLISVRAYSQRCMPELQSFIQALAARCFNERKGRPSLEKGAVDL